MFIFARITLPFCSFINFSIIGVNCLQGSHQGAQKSTITGISFDFSITSDIKFSVTTSIIILSLLPALILASFLSESSNSIFKGRHPEFRPFLSLWLGQHL